MTLRPVGTEFEIEYPPALSSTDPHPHIARYRVKAHSLVGRFVGDPDPQPAEELECLSYDEMVQP